MITLVSLFVFFFSYICGASTNVITVGMAANLESADPVKVWNTAEMFLVSSYCRPLTRISESGQIEGDLVESWKITSSFKKYTFTLKDGVLFHDGSKLKSRDVAYSFSRHFWKEFDSGYRHHLAFATGSDKMIASGEILDNFHIIDDRTFSFSLKNPYLPFLYMISQTCLCIVKEGSPLIGTGPMMVSQQKPDMKWELRKSPYYKGERGNIDKIIVTTMNDYGKAVDSLKKGNVDILIGSQFSKRKDASDLKKSKLDFISINHFLINPRKRKFRETRRRELFGRLLQSLAWKGENRAFNQEKSKTLIPNGYFSNASLVSEMEIDEVKREISKIKGEVASPVKIVLVEQLFSPSFFSDIEKKFAKLGVQLNLKKISGPDWVKYIEEGDYDISHLPMRPSFFDPDGIFYVLQSFFRKDQYFLFDEVKRYRSLTDKNKRMKKYIDLLLNIEKEWVLIPAYSEKTPFLKTDNIQMPKTKYRNEFESWKIVKR